LVHRRNGFVGTKLLRRRYRVFAAALGSGPLGDSGPGPRLAASVVGLGLGPPHTLLFTVLVLFYSF
jgi:hypothetical protein